MPPLREVRRGMRPSLCAITSSGNTLEFSKKYTDSIAKVGVSAIMILRSEFATEASV